jgi:hypothetical protein
VAQNSNDSTRSRFGLPGASTMKRWFLDHDSSDAYPDPYEPEGESQDHLLAASIAAAAVLAMFIIVTVVAAISLAGRLVVAW